MPQHRTADEPLLEHLRERGSGEAEGTGREGRRLEPEPVEVVFARRKKIMADARLREPQG